MILQINDKNFWHVQIVELYSYVIYGVQIKCLFCGLRELSSSLKHSLISSISVEESNIFKKNKKAEGAGKIGRKKHEKLIVQCCSFTVPSGIMGFYISIKHEHCFFSA